MKKMFGLSILCLLIILSGCSMKKELTEKEKLVSYLKTVGYDCVGFYCETPKENSNIYLLDDVYGKEEWSHLNLTNGTIKESVYFLETDLWAGENVTMILWESNYTLETENYEVNYEYLEKIGDEVITLANGTKTNSNFSYKDFPQDYLDVSPHLKFRSMEMQSIEIHNALIRKWDRIFELAGIDKEKLIEEFKE